MMIEFLLDENLPFALIDFLEKKGFRVNHLKKMGKSGIKNGAVYKIAEQSKSWIIVKDNQNPTCAERNEEVLGKP